MQFKLRHGVGIALCLGGLAALVAADIDDSGGGGHSRSDVILGDSLCLIASLFYSVSNVGQEAAVKRFDAVNKIKEEYCVPIVCLFCCMAWFTVGVLGHVGSVWIGYQHHPARYLGTQGTVTCHMV